MKSAVHHARVREVVQEPTLKAHEWYGTKVCECELADPEATSVVAEEILCGRDVVRGNCVARLGYGVKVKPGISWSAEGSRHVRKWTRVDELTGHNDSVGLGRILCRRRSHSLDLAWRIRQPQSCPSRSRMGGMIARHSISLESSLSPASLQCPVFSMLQQLP